VFAGVTIDRLMVLMAIKVNGVKRHVIIDKNDFLIAVKVCVANFQDSKAALLLLRMIKEFLCPINLLIADGEVQEVNNRFSQKDL
jgi:hypothetical protein